MGNLEVALASVGDKYQDPGRTMLVQQMEAWFQLRKRWQGGPPRAHVGGSLYRGWKTLGVGGSLSEVRNHCLLA